MNYSFQIPLIVVLQLKYQLLAVLKLGNLSKPRRQSQRERRQTKGLMSRTMAVYVSYQSVHFFAKLCKTAT